MNKKNKHIENEFAHRLSENKKEVHDFRLFINDFDVLGHELDTMYNRLYTSTTDDLLELNISSTGGYLWDLIRLQNMCKEHFYNRVTAKLHYGFSCGAYAFLLGDERICYEDSYIMFHNASSGIEGKMSDIETQFNFDKKYHEKFIKDRLSPYFTQLEIQSIWDGKDFWLNTIQMCERKICTQVYAFGEYMDADLYLEFMKNRTEHKKLIKIMYEGLDKFNKADADKIEFEYKKLFKKG